jgi:GNAT superfamily N-acetyltransferase
MSELALRRAGPADAATITALLAAAGAALVTQGFRNWESAYPLERVQRDIEERAVFLVTDGGESVGTFTLGRAPVIPYVPPPWPDAAASAAYLNRMAILPSRQGSGLGRWCLAELDREARALGTSAVRCDVVADNGRLCRFYEGHGYRAWGTREHSGWLFRCYERRLVP